MIQGRFLRGDMIQGGGVTVMPWTAGRLLLLAKFLLRWLSGIYGLHGNQGSYQSIVVMADWLRYRVQRTVNDLANRRLVYLPAFGD